MALLKVSARCLTCGSWIKKITRDFVTLFLTPGANCYLHVIPGATHSSCQPGGGPKTGCHASFGSLHVQSAAPDTPTLFGWNSHQLDIARGRLTFFQPVLPTLRVPDRPEEALLETGITACLCEGLLSGGDPGGHGENV